MTFDTRAPLSIQSARTINVGRGSGGTPILNDWQLPSGQYIPAKMPPQFVNCFPDSESFSDERHRRVPAGVASSHPVAVQGGARPFRYELTSAPTGVTIDDHGVIAWSDQVTGTHTITVRVRTQDYARQPYGRTDEVWGEITQTWTMEFADREDATKFIWLAEDGDNSNDGSFSSPKQTLDHVLASTEFNGRQIHLKSGTYTTNGPNQFRLGDNRPRVIAGAGKDLSFLSYTERNIQYADDGCYCSGFTTLDGGYETSNIRLFVIGPGVNRKGWYDIKFLDTRRGTQGTDNATSIFSSGNNTPRHFTSIHSCEDVGRNEGSTNVSPLFTLFSDNDVAVEYSSFDGLGSGGVNIKDSNQRWTVAFCVFKNENNGGGSVIVGCQSPERLITEDIEICYNFLDGIINLNYQSVPECGSMYVYRNSVKGRIRALQSNTETAGPYVIENNAVEATSTPIITEGSSMELSENIAESSGVFDSEFNLTETYSEFLGFRGSQISGGTQ